jgi:hypothetical protein
MKRPVLLTGGKDPQIFLSSCYLHFLLYTVAHTQSLGYYISVHLINI